MSRVFWRESTSPAQIGRNRKTITVPAFSSDCGQPNASIEFKGSGTACSYALSASAFNPFTLEFWIKPNGANGQKFVAKEHPTYSFFVTLNLNFSLTVTVYGSTGTHVDLNTGVYLTSGQWAHLAFTRSFSAGTTTIKMYLNGSLVYTGTTATISNDYVTAAIWTFGGSAADGTLFSGFMSEMRIWTVVRTAEQIQYGYNKRCGSPINANLPIRFSCQEGAGVIANNKGNEGEFVILNGTTVIFNTDEYPHVIYGASFIAAQFPINFSTILNNISIHPFQRPDDINFLLAVSWTDDNGDFQRRSLWDTIEGLDIAPYPADYNGEKLPSSGFTLECWNIDGNSTIDLAEDLIINVSFTTRPGSSFDTAQVSYGIGVKESALAQNFPLNAFPLPFAVQQTY